MFVLQCYIDMWISNNAELLFSFICCVVSMAFVWTISAKFIFKFKYQFNQKVFNSLEHFENPEWFRIEIHRKRKEIISNMCVCVLVVCFIKYGKFILSGTVDDILLVASAFESKRLLTLSHQIHKKNICSFEKFHFRSLFCFWRK